MLKYQSALSASHSSLLGASGGKFYQDLLAKSPRTLSYFASFYSQPGDPCYTQEYPAHRAVGEQELQ